MPAQSISVPRGENCCPGPGPFQELPGRTTGQHKAKLCEGNRPLWLPVARDCHDQNDTRKAFIRVPICRASIHQLFGSRRAAGHGTSHCQSSRGLRRTVRPQSRAAFGWRIRAGRCSTPAPCTAETDQA